MAIQLGEIALIVSLRLRKLRKPQERLDVLVAQVHRQVVLVALVVHLQVEVQESLQRV